MAAAADAAPDFRRFFELAPYPSLVLRADRRFTVAAASDRYLEMLMSARAEVAGRPVGEVLGGLLSNSARRELQQSLARVARGTGRETIEFVDDAANHAAGRDARCWRAVNVPLPGVDGEQHFVIHQLEDITERRRAQGQLSLTASVFHSIHDGVMVTDERARILSVNPAFTEITGYSAAEAIGRKPSLMRSEHHGPDFYRELWAVLLSEGRWEGEIWNRRKNGEAFLEWLTISRVADDDGLIVEGPMGGKPVRYVGVFNDITESRRNDEHIRHLAFHDPLTGLPNRALMLDRLSHAIDFAERGKARLGVMFIDLDRFKEINDSLGHHTGDDLLREVAGRLGRCLRQSDTVARIGGDEFVVLLEHAEEREVYARLAQDIVSTVGAPFLIDGHTLQIGASIGIACFPDDGRDGSELMKNADAAMYVAKAAGRSTYRFFRPVSSETASGRQHLEAELRNALPNEEFELHYQAKVFLDNHVPYGFEASLRWRHPSLGLLQPADFVPLAETMGLITRIGDWVIEEACRQCAEWQAQGFGRKRIALTVAASQLQEGDLVATIAGLAERYGITPNELEIKFTESVILGQPERVAAIVGGLHAIGVSVAVDDFGTGDSTLACLRRLPIDSLSIDRSLIRSADRDEKDARIVRSILALGRTLDVTVVAEGIETESQSDFLRACGCTLGQGYLYAHPAPAAQVEKWLRAPRGAGPEPPAAMPH